MTRAVFVVSVCLAFAWPAAGQVARMSVSTDGVEANGPSGPPSVSASGRYVVFSSSATNLVANDTNGVPDIFLRDRDTDADGIFDEAGAVATTRISQAGGTTQADGPSTEPVITADGRYVAFVSTATNLVAGANTFSQVYRVDRTTGEIVRVSETAAGDARSQPSDNPAISADGDVVAFRSTAANAAEGSGDSNGSLIFIREISAGVTTRLSASPPRLIFSDSTRPSISADGRRIAYTCAGSFSYIGIRSCVQDRITGLFLMFGEGHPTPRISASGSTVVLRGTTGGGFGTVQRSVVDTQSATPSLDAPAPAGTPPIQPAVSSDGRYVLTDGAQLNDFDLGAAISLGFVPGGGAFSADNRWLAVVTGTSTLLPGNADTNGVDDVFVIDLPARLDLDHDTMDDRWETLFGVTDPNADPDNDGVTNAAEEDAGTHPNGSVKRYLAEGATGTFFATWISLANPDLVNPATAVLTFDSGSGIRVSRPVSLGAGNSTTIEVGAISGLEGAAVSTTIESDRLLAVNRLMEWGSGPESLGHYGSHAETATAAPSTTWFLAEGSTVLDFDLFYLLQNPQTTVAHTTVRYLLPSGTVVTRSYDLAPGSRTTVYVNAIPGLDETDVSGGVSADVPIVVERAMYRSVPGKPFLLGTGSMGVPAAATRWFLAEGATGSFFDTYVLIANPGDTDALVTAEFARPDGTVVTQNYTVGAHSRFSVFVDDIAALANTAVATTVTSTNGVPIVVERAMYWPGGFFDYYEGHSSAGATATALTWATGGVGGTDPLQTFILIANTENRPGQAEVRVLKAGAGSGPTLVDLPPNSRTTIELIPPSFGVLVTSVGATPVQLVVESTSYRTQRDIDPITPPGDILWSTGSNALATPIVP